MWHGTAASLIDLHPEGWDYSEATGTDGAQQVGWTQNEGGFVQAALWSGSDESFQNLHPPEIIGDSLALDVEDGVQVGGITTAAFEIRAAMWHGSASSYTDMHPPGATGSYATAIHQGNIVGQVNGRAAYWPDARGSYIDLHAMLPAAYDELSIAYDVHEEEDGTIIVAGAALTTDLVYTAYLWIRAPLPPSCPGDTNADNLVDFADLNTLLSEFNQVLPDPQADFDGDGDVDFADLNTLLGAFNMPCA